MPQQKDVRHRDTTQMVMPGYLWNFYCPVEGSCRTVQWRHCVSLGDIHTHRRQVEHLWYRSRTRRGVRLRRRSSRHKLAITTPWPVVLQGLEGAGRAGVRQPL